MWVKAKPIEEHWRQSGVFAGKFTYIKYNMCTYVYVAVGKRLTWENGTKTWQAHQCWGWLKVNRFDGDHMW